jgi:Mlc titration factor MtfA (ptsG expression regulator)
MFGLFRRRPAPLPERWHALLTARVPHVERLAPELRARFEVRVMEFLGAKKFYGCNGLAVTEEMRVLIAGMACLLILRPDARVYPHLRSVLLYPTAFWVRHQEPDEIGVVYEDEVLQVGESQEWGRVVLSWEDAQAVYLIGFSLAHFWEGFTGLTVTVLAIVTLFVLMQLTGRVRWSSVLGGSPAAQPQAPAQPQPHGA